MIPAWYDISNPQTGSFFHEFAQALGKFHDVSLLKTDYFSFSQSIPDNLTDSIGNKSYKYFEFFYKNKFPLKLLKSSVSRERNRMLKKANKAIDEIQKKHGSFDAVHLLSACHMVTPLIAKSISERNNIPLIITEHFSGFQRLSNDFYAPFATLSEIKEIVNNASLRIGVSEKSSKNYSNFFNSEFDVCHNLIPDHFIPDQIPDRSSDLFNFLIVGHLNENKGQLRVLRAFHEISEKREDLRLTIIGKGNLKESLINFISQHDLTDKVNLINEVSREGIIRNFDQCDVLLSTSIVETFGLTLVEAHFRGKPVISTRSGGPNEIINEQNGVLIEPDNHEELVEAMNSIINNYSKFNPRLISEKAISLYSEKAIVERMNEFYSSVI